MYLIEGLIIGAQEKSDLKHNGSNWTVKNGYDGLDLKTYKQIIGV